MLDTWTIIPTLDQLLAVHGPAREVRVSPSDMGRLCRYMVEKFPRLKQKGNATLDFRGSPLIADETLEPGEVEWIPVRKTVVAQ